KITTRHGTRGCVVIKGTLRDPYTGDTIRFRKAEASAVQIDHVVSLSDAWQKGAQQWTAEQREEFANSFLNLRAVSGSANAAKGDGDAATWLPPNKAARCEYVAWQVIVKATFELWVTQAEHDAMARVLSGCTGDYAPDEADFTPSDPDPSTDEPAPKPKPKKTTPPAPERTQPPAPKKTTK